MSLIRRLRTCIPALLLAALLPLFGAGPSLAGHVRPPADKTGILLVAFGTSVPKARAAYATIGQLAAQAFPGVEVRWAYTSGTVRRKLTQDGEKLDSPALALARMLDDGYGRVAVQPLHVVPGQEYHDLARTVAAFRQLPDGFARLILGDPLLAGPDALPAAAKILKAIAPKAQRGQAVVLAGHGTGHGANAFYPALQHYLGAGDADPILGTVEGSPGLLDLDDVLARLRERKAKAVWLMPFMAVAGDHAVNDLAGPEADSWKSVLEKEGFEVRPLLKGLAEYPEMAGLWIDHLRAAVKALDATSGAGAGH